MVEGVGGADGSGGGDVDGVASIVEEGGANVKSAEAVRGPGGAVFGAEVGDAKLARRVEGMGFEVEFKSMEAVPGGYGGGGWRVGRRGPRAKVVEGKFGHGEEEVPEIRGESIVSGGEDGKEVIFGGLNGTFSR